MTAAGNSTMAILSIAPQPFFTNRGTPFSVYYRAVSMAQAGARIDLLTYGNGQEIDVPGIRIVRIPRIRWLEPVPIGPSWQKLCLDCVMVIWTIGLLLKHRYPVVHAHEEAIFWSRPLKSMLGFKLIYDMHSSLPQQLTNFQFTKSRLLIWIFRKLESWGIAGSDVVITVCPDLRDQVLGFGLDQSRHLLIENTRFDEVKIRTTDDKTDCRAADPSAEFSLAEKVIYYGGTFESYQGIEVLISAMAIVRRRAPGARLHMVGGTPAQVVTARALADSLDLGAACVIAGRTTKEEVSRHIRRADILVSPRLVGTNTPMKIYEQLASGKPLVATRIPSHTQVLDDSICFLVEPDALSLADGLVLALEDGKESSRRAAKARDHFDRHYSSEAYDEKVRQALVKVLPCVA